MWYHPVVNIDIDKGRYIRKYEHKAISFINQKLEEVITDSTNWTGKIIDTVDMIINKHNLDKLEPDILIKLFNSSKAMRAEFSNDLSSMNINDINNFMKKKLDSVNDPDEIAATNEVYLGLDNKYAEVEDITMAQIIILLSKLAMLSDKLYVSITLQMKEFPHAIFYFKPDDGNIMLSARSFNRAARAIEHPELDNYIKAMNDLINGNRSIPGVR